MWFIWLVILALSISSSFCIIRMYCINFRLNWILNSSRFIFSCSYFPKNINSCCELLNKNFFLFKSCKSLLKVITCFLFFILIFSKDLSLIFNVTDGYSIINQIVKIIIWKNFVQIWSFYMLVHFISKSAISWIIKKIIW